MRLPKRCVDKRSVLGSRSEPVCMASHSPSRPLRVQFIPLPQALHPPAAGKQWVVHAHVFLFWECYQACLGCFAGLHVGDVCL